ncbi:hypothetical protein [Ornithinibacillus contaminans]|uniref:hypothetical protein n=1 Tax=Ornithinibacillus contaminans TaxID=694055 RepID=UPI00064DB96E|nr:hypothetical protein [Ornithinibacillus contaminans]
MSDNKDKTPEKLKVELGGMGLYGTTGNGKIGGYSMSGDIENAGQLDKGFKKHDDESGAIASRDDSNARDD